MKNFIIIILAFGMAFYPFSNSHILVPLASAQNISSSSTLDTKNTDGNLNPEYKTYILIFGQRTIGNVDNSTKIVSSIVGHNLIKIEEEFLEELSLAPSQQLENQVEKVINDGINGKQCEPMLWMKAIARVIKAIGKNLKNWPKQFHIH